MPIAYLSPEPIYLPQRQPVVEPTTGAIHVTWFKFLQELVHRGHWTTLAFLAANFTASPSMTWVLTEADQVTLSYTIAGKTMTVAFTLENTSVGGVVSSALRIALPPGRVATRAMASPVRIRDNGTWTTGEASVVADGTYITIQRTDGANFTLSTNATDVRGQLTLEVAR